VAISDNLVLLGAPGDSTRGNGVGQAHLLDAATGNFLWTFNDPSPTPPGNPIFGGDGFGSSVAIDGNRVLIGAPYHTVNGVSVGQAHLFDAVSGELLHTFDDPTPSPGYFNSDIGDSFGRSVAINGNFVLVGAHGDRTLGNYVGQAHLFDATTGELIKTFNDPHVTDADTFGSAVALDGNHVLIGSPGDDSIADGVGQVHLFALSLPGDYDSNGVVDIADYVVWRDRLGTAYVQTDYDIWKENFGKTPGRSAVMAETIPEPSALALLASVFIHLGICFIRACDVQGTKYRPSTPFSFSYPRINRKVSRHPLEHGRCNPDPRGGRKGAAK
jgi:hypothetical protein